MSKKELSDRSKELLTSEKVIEKFSIICDKNQDLKIENKELKIENKELKKENHRLLSHLNEDKLRYMDRFIYQNEVIYDNLTDEYYDVEDNSIAQSLTNVLNNLNNELNKYKEFEDMFKSLMKKYDINSIEKLDKILFNRLDLW